VGAEGVCADAWLVAKAITQKTRQGITLKIKPKNIEKKPRMNAKIGLSAVTSPGGEGFVEVVKGEEMQDDGEFQAQYVPRPFSDDKGVIGRGLLAQIHVVSAGEVIGAADHGDGELGIEENLPPRTRSGRIAQSHRSVHRSQDDDAMGDAVFDVVVEGGSVGDFRREEGMDGARAPIN